MFLIDELDRTDEAFEAFLLEVLSDFQVTIPELGTIRADEPPIVIITTNRTREIHDALKRRCLYHWVDYPRAAQELEIIRRKVPGCNATLSREIVAYVQRLRRSTSSRTPASRKRSTGPRHSRSSTRWRSIPRRWPIRWGRFSNIRTTSPGSKVPKAAACLPR